MQEDMEKTGIASIDKFFRYGESSSQFAKLPFSALLPGVIQIFTSEYTCNLHDRKANAVLKFTQSRPHGFFYEEIEGLTRLVTLMKDDLFKGVEEMVNAVKSVLAVNSPDPNNMFNKNLGSDELRYIQQIPAFLDSLEPFLRYHQHVQKSPSLDSLRECVIDYLIRFAERQIPEIMSNEESFENQKNDGSETSPIQVLLQQGTKHLRALCESKVLEALIQLLFDYNHQQELVGVMLELLSFMMMYSRLAEELSQRGAAHVVLEIMLLSQDFRSVSIKTGFEIFWSLIEGAGVESLSALANQQYICALQTMLVRVVREGYKLEDKCLRNQIVILVNYLLSLPETIGLFFFKKEQNQPSFLEVLFSYASVDQEKFYDCKSRVADSKVEFGTNAEDLQLKKLLWSGLLSAIESGNSDVIELAQRAGFIKYLLVYIDSANTSYAVTRWSSPQLRELQQHALSVLANIILHMKDDFEEKKGIFCLTKFLSNVNDIERREKCLKAFSNASLFEESYKIKITEEGIVDYLLEFLQGDENPIEIKELCFTILANLCKDCKKNKKLFREKHGVDIIISYLKDQNIATSNRYVLLGLSLLNCIWNAILGSRRSEERFLNSQGLFDLLEFIQVCEYSHRKMTLSCLSFLTENTKAVKEFLQWNSEKTMINATQLMVKLYSEEDEKYGVKYANGIVLNRTKPLTPEIAKKTPEQPAYLKDFTETGTETYLVNRIKEVVSEYDIRLIVFSILYRVGFAKNDLTAFEQQKIEVIQMYPHFKIGEIWGEIKSELRREGVQPTEEDQHWMDTCLQEFQEQMENCVNTQHLIMREYNKSQEGELGKFYQVIRHNKPVK